jgi:hypothetical protein
MRQNRDTSKLQALYVLVDPRNNRVCYVGKSVDPSGRLLAQYNAARGGKRSRRSLWIRSLLDEGLSPIQCVLAWGSQARVGRLEAALLMRYLAAGHWMANTQIPCAAADGGTAVIQIPAHLAVRVRAFIKESGHTMSQFAALAISEYINGTAAPPHRPPKKGKI